MRRMYSEKQIASQIKSVIESGQVDNAKPIYCHPITMGYIVDSGNNFAVTMLIFNNEATAFTWATFKTWLNNLITKIETVRILTSGYCKIEGNIFPADYLFATSSAKQVVSVPGVIDDAKLLDLTSIWASMSPTQFFDGVNKIN